MIRFAAHKLLLKSIYSTDNIIHSTDPSPLLRQWEEIEQVLAQLVGGPQDTHIHHTETTTLRSLCRRGNNSIMAAHSWSWEPGNITKPLLCSYGSISWLVMWGHRNYCTRVSDSQEFHDYTYTCPLTSRGFWRLILDMFAVKLNWLLDLNGRG